MSDLSERKCTPCRGGVPPVKGAALTDLMTQLGGGWNQVDERPLEKEWCFKNFREALA